MDSKMTESFRISIASSDEEALELQNAWKNSPCANRSEFIKLAVNSYAMMYNYAEKPIFQNVKVL